MEQVRNFQKFYESKSPSENFSKKVVKNVQCAADNIGKNIMKWQ